MSNYFKKDKYKFLEPNPYEEGLTYRTFLAKNLKKDEKVAIKILKQNFFSLDDCKRHKEVQIVQSLSHKNVLKMYELINDSDELLMVFEYMPENVKGVMKKRDSPYSETETKVIMQQVFQGLSYIHKTGVMHRNLRPEILLCDKEVTTVKISDFAMAKSLLDTFGEYSVTPVWYMAPEVLLGENNYTIKIDMWAAGCIMAEMLTGKPLMPGTSDRDQMKLICELLGTFTKREWPDGAMLRHSIGYSLPTSVTGKGLTAAGLDASSEAKGLIMELLTWSPEKRLSADLALRHDFFKSDGEFVNKDASQEILDSARHRLEEWKHKWGADFTRGSFMEFEGILAEFNKSQSHKDKSSNKQPYVGFEKSSPLVGDSTPRGKWSQPQSNGNNTTVDDQFRMQRTKVLSEPGQQYPLDNSSSDKKQERSPFEEELTTREERRSRQSVQNTDPLFSADGKMSPRRTNTSPRRYNNDQLGLFGGEQTSGQGEQEQNERKMKAEQLKERNYTKYMAKFGFREMKGVLGAQSPVPGERNEPISSRRMNPEVGKNNSQQESMRTRPQYTKEDLTPRRGPTNRLTSAEKYASIDHNARSERLKQMNPTKQKDKYGDPFMNELLGKKPDRKATSQNSDNNFPDEGSNGYGPGRSGQYTPSWADNQIRTH